MSCLVYVCSAFTLPSKSTPLFLHKKTISMDCPNMLVQFKSFISAQPTPKSSRISDGEGIPLLKPNLSFPGRQTIKNAARQHTQKTHTPRQLTAGSLLIIFVMVSFISRPILEHSCRLTLLPTKTSPCSIKRSIFKLNRAVEYECNKVRR